jgi:hypothetical protein
MDSYTWFTPVWDGYWVFKVPVGFNFLLKKFNFFRHHKRISIFIFFIRLVFYMTVLINMRIVDVLRQFSQTNYDIFFPNNKIIGIFVLKFNEIDTVPTIYVLYFHNLTISFFLNTFSNCFNSSFRSLSILINSTKLNKDLLPTLESLFHTIGFLPC